METETGALSASELAALAGVTEAEVNRMVGLGILVTRDGAGPFLAADAQKIRLATACEQAGLPMDGIASAIRAGRLSFAFLEAAPFRRWAVRSARTYRQVSQETGIPLDLLGSALESMGFARMAPDELIREDELEIVPLLRLGFSSGLLDLAWTTRLGRAHAEGLRLVAAAWADVYHARFEGAVLASGGDQPTARELAARQSVDFLPLADPALLAIYRRQQELVWTEDLVERIELELEAAGVLGRPERLPAMSFVDLVGYTRLTEEQGDAAAAELAGSLAVLVDRSSREHGGVPVKWLGDGVMVHFREPAGAVLSALRMVQQLPQAGLPPAHVGVAAGPVMVQGGDYFGRTVNLAARIAARAGAGQVLVSDSVAGVGLAPGRALCGAGAAAVEGDRPAGTGAGGLRRVSTSAPPDGEPEGSGRSGSSTGRTPGQQLLWVVELVGGRRVIAGACLRPDRQSSPKAQTSKAPRRFLDSARSHALERRDKGVKRGEELMGAYEDAVHTLGVELGGVEQAFRDLTDAQWRMPTKLRPLDESQPHWTLFELAGHFDMAWVRAASGRAEHADPRLPLIG